MTKISRSSNLQDGVVNQETNLKRKKREEKPMLYLVAGKVVEKTTVR